MGKRDAGFLDGAYDLESPEKTGAFYDEWAETYDRELGENGYATPRRCAAVLAAGAPDRSAPIVDLGCGTGLSGFALREAGFTTIDGFDYSAEMLERAAARPGLYRTIDRIDLNAPLPYGVGAYALACAAGVINPGHAPASAVRSIVAALPPGGLFAFSLNDHALAVPEFASAPHVEVEAGRAELVSADYGDHIPGTGLKAMVYLLRRR